MTDISENKTLRFRFTIVITLLWGLALMLSPFKVMASDTVANPTLTLTYVGGEGSSISTYINNVNTYISSLSIDSNELKASEKFSPFIFLSYKDNGIANVGSIASCEVTMDLASYKVMSQKVKNKIMGYALDSIKNSSISTIASNKIYNFIQSQDESTASLVRQLSNDVDADFSSAYMMFKPFSGILGTTLGLFALLIFVTLTLMILVDLSYIVIPIIRDFLTPSSADAKPKYVSNEAWYAVKETDSATDTHKSVLVIYLKKKTMQFVALSICILYLLSGRIYILIGDIMDMFRGIIE